LFYYTAAGGDVKQVQADAMLGIGNLEEAARMVEALYDN
jgi:hypothetical protein